MPIRVSTPATALLLCCAALAIHAEALAEGEPAVRAPAEDSPGGDAKQDGSSGWAGFPVAVYLPDTGLLLGGYLYHHFRLGAQAASVPSSSVALLAAWTTRDETGAELTPELYLGPRGSLWIEADLTARHQPGDRFFGIGNRTRSDDEELFTRTFARLDSNVVYHVGHQVFVGAAQRSSWESVDPGDPDGPLATSAPPGVDGGFALGLGPALAYDTRSTHRSPRSGTYVQLHAPWHPRWLGSDHAFAKLTLDARQYLQLSGEHVLAARLLVQLSAGAVPFTQLPAVADSGFMRGYLRGRFRDAHAYGVELEYRFPIAWRFGGVVFAGAGRVTETPEDLDVARLHYAAGIGLRFTLVEEDRLKLRLDGAYAPQEGSFRPYFAPTEAF